MKIIIDPTVYYYEAEKGLFITLDDFRATPGLIKSLRNNIERQLRKAIFHLNYYRGIHESGEHPLVSRSLWTDGVNVSTLLRVLTTRYQRLRI